MTSSGPTSERVTRVTRSEPPRAFTLYATHNGGRLPDPFVNHIAWETSLSPYVGKNVFRCNADEEVFPAVGSSYDWRDTGDESTTLAAHKITDVCRADLLLAYESLPAWHARKMINAVRLDGSAITLDQEDCFADIRKPVR